MWLFNFNAINNLLLFLLLFAMIMYFLRRSKKNIETASIIVFMIQLVLWQFCFLIRNIYYDPAAAYPLYYFLNSGYTVISYLALVMFSYNFVTPVFKKEAKIVFITGLAVSIGFIIYSSIVVFPGEIKTFYDPVLHVYDAEPAPHRRYMLMVLLVFIILVGKNLIYKILIYRGEQRAFVLNLAIALLTGISAVVGVSLIHQFYPIDPIIHNTINVYISGTLFIYFYLVYLSYSRIAFFYSDKTILMILFIMIIIGSMTTSLTFMVYEREYIKSTLETVRRIARDMETAEKDDRYLRERLKYVYGDSVGYIITRNADRTGGTIYLGTDVPIDESMGDRTDASRRYLFHAAGVNKFYRFEAKVGESVLHVGIPYLNYRRYVHSFVRAGFITLLTITCVLFVFMRFVIFIGLTRPLKRLLAGTREISDGNLNHHIEVTSQDEVGNIARSFNLMVDNLRVSGDVIKKSEQKFRELTGMLPDIVYETDLELNVTYFNRAGLMITGYNDEDIQKGLSLNELLDSEEYHRLRRLLSGRKDRGVSIITTHKIKIKNGSTIWGENNAAVIHENGIPLGLRGVIRDVTEKILIENSLIQAQKMETIGTLAGGIAHDFNNILTGITGTVSLMEHRIKRNGSVIIDDIMKNINTLKLSAGRAADIVKQLMYLSRKVKSDLRKVDLNTVAMNVYDICANSFDKIIKLDFKYHTGGAYARADETQLCQVLLNLCVNSRDAMTIMRQGGSDLPGVLSVYVDMVLADQVFYMKFKEAADLRYCRLRVRDSGVGMDQETISRVFDPFFTMKPNGKGTGLGLTMVYNIIKQHNGFIDISSTPMEGTTIDVYIPSTDTYETTPDHENIETELKNLDSMILLADDDPIVQKICGEMLYRMGCKVIKAANGQECVDIYRKSSDEIDLVILDVMMPVMSGNETYDELRTINPQIVVLISSGYGDDPRIDEMFKKGANGFIQKPYTLEELHVELTRILKRY